MPANAITAATIAPPKTMPRAVAIPAITAVGFSLTNSTTFSIKGFIALTALSNCVLSFGISFSANAFMRSKTCCSFGAHSSNFFINLETASASFAAMGKSCCPIVIPTSLSRAPRMRC